MFRKKLLFRDVLVARSWIGHIDRMLQYAVELGYPYFLWNGKIYELVREGGFVPTNYLLEDVE